MRDWDEEADRFVTNHLHVWMQTFHLKPLAEAVRKNRDDLIREVAKILREEGKGFDERADAARACILSRALESVRIEFGTDHFVLFKETETVQVILEDAFGVQAGRDVDRVAPPFQEEAAKIIVRCLFRDRSKLARVENLLDFFRFFFKTGGGPPSDPEKIMRYKSTVWFVYLLIDLIRTDREDICRKGPGFLKSRFKTLLDKAAEGKIINEEYASSRYGYEGGKWDRTLFGWLQGEDRKPFVERLVKQFNLENRAEHGSRLILARHRECMYGQAIELFCRPTA